MKIIIFTVNCGTTHPIFNEWKHYDQKNAGELYGDYILAGHNIAGYDRTKNISAYIMNSSSNKLLISNAFNNRKEFEDLYDALGSITLTINKVFMKMTTRELSDEDKKFHQHHARWIGYTVKDLEILNAQYLAELHDLRTAIEQKGIEVVIIDE